MITDMVGMGVDYTYARVVGTYTDTYYTTVNGQSVHFRLPLGWGQDFDGILQIL